MTLGSRWMLRMRSHSLSTRRRTGAALVGASPDSRERMSDYAQHGVACVVVDCAICICILGIRTIEELHCGGVLSLQGLPICQF